MKGFALLPAMMASLYLAVAVRSLPAQEPAEGISLPTWPPQGQTVVPDRPGVFMVPGFDQAAPETAPACAPKKPLFTCGRWTAEALSGAMFAPTGIGPRTPTFDYVPISLRLGYILTDPVGTGFLRGCGEVLVDGTVAPVVNGFGRVLGGPSLLLRYNFVQPNARLVPYLQGGAGFVFTDAHADRSQRAIGSCFEFLLQTGVGCRYLLNEHWAVNAEVDFQHISNANTNPRNAGINAAGGLIGLTYFFPRGR